MISFLEFVSPEGILHVLLTPNPKKLSLINGQAYYSSERFGIVRVKQIKFELGE